MKKKNLLGLKKAVLIFTVAAFFPACGFFGGEKAGARKLFVIKKDGKYGYIDKQGKIVVEPQFNRAMNFSEGLAQVEKFKSSAPQGVVKMEDTETGFIDETGKFVIEPKFHSGTSKDYRFSEGVAVFPSEWFTPEGEVSIEPKKTVAIDKTGKILFELDENKQQVGAFFDGLLLVKIKEPQENWRGTKNGAHFKYGYVDKTGKFVIEPKEMLSANPFSEGLALVKIYRTTPQGYGGNTYCGFIDKTGKTVIEPKYKEAFDFHDGVARVTEADSQDKYSDGERFGFIDRNENWVGGRGYDAVSDFRDGVAIIPHYGKSEIRGKEKMESNIYVDGAILTYFSEGLSVLLDAQNKLQIIGKDGKTIAPVDAAIKADSKTIAADEGFQGGLIRIISNGEAFYVDKTGKIVWHEQAEFGETL